MKLWDKGKELTLEIETFTVGSDYILDQRLIPYDVKSSIAHAEMLKSIGLLSDEELASLMKGLTEISGLAKEGKFGIRQQDEDCHTAIENYLVARFGDTGKKIHTGRSRNDQVLTAIRLYEKDALSSIKSLCQSLTDILSKCIAEHGDISIPGYTHMQKAMPTTVSIWLSCFADSMKDNIVFLESVLRLIDQSPLGTAAGFGVPVLPIDRKMTCDLLGFSRVQENPVYAQMSRGKFEADISHACGRIMYDLNKLASDLILYQMPEFGYLSLPESCCTGSSIMPQKKNPDVLELVRGKYHEVIGEEVKIKSLIGNLISGYNRDLQLTKQSLFTVIDITSSCLSVMQTVISGMEINKGACEQAVTGEMYATQKAYELVLKGVPFREAYRQIAQNLSAEGPSVKKDVKR
ncbi:MAG: argininosuccinate lyase [Oligoflexales bacterium]|nr:argininosuccinate lyase [Oligoflexales bacterium]